MKKKSAEEILRGMSSLLRDYLEELDEISCTDKNYDFVKGEKVAYAECLEMMQSWEYAERAGLDYDVEECLSL